MSDRRIRHVGALFGAALALLVFVAFLAILSRHFWEEYRSWRAIPDVLQRRAANNFYVIQYYVSCAQERLQARDSAAKEPVSMTAAWEEYLKTAASYELPDVHSYNIEHCDGLTLFRARIQSPGERLVVGVPSGEESLSNYVAVAYVNADCKPRERRAVVAYSPSNPGRIFVAPAERDTDIAEVLLHTVSSYDWSQPFNPDPQRWPEFYPIGAEYDGLGWITPRDRQEQHH